MPARMSMKRTLMIDVSRTRARTSWRFTASRGGRCGGARRDAVAEDPVAPDPLLVQFVEEHRLQDAEAVAHAAPETDLGGLVEVAGLDRHFRDAHPLGHGLGDDLGVE